MTKVVFVTPDRLEGVSEESIEESVTALQRRIECSEVLFEHGSPNIDGLTPHDLAKRVCEIDLSNVAGKITAVDYSPSTGITGEVEFSGKYKNTDTFCEFTMRSLVRVQKEYIWCNQIITFDLTNKE